MKHMRLLALALTLTMSLTAFAGCGNTASSSAGTSNTDKSAGGSSSTGQTSAWPTEDNLNILIPAKAGGVNDTIARLMQEYLQTKCGATVVINNYDTKAVAYDALAKADPDGYTIMLQHTTIFPEAAAGSAGVMPMEDMTVLGEINTLGASAYVAPMDAPYDTFSGLIEYAKEHPGEITAAYAAGGMSHFQWGAIERDAGIQLKMLDASSESEKLTNVAGGFLDLASVTYATAKEYAEAGRLKILAVGNAPEVAQEFGYEQMEDLGVNTLITTYMYVWGPAGMDQAVVERINQVLMEMTEDADFQAKMEQVGYPTITVSLEDATAAAQSEMDNAAELAQQLGLAG